MTNQLATWKGYRDFSTAILQALGYLAGVSSGAYLLQLLFFKWIMPEMGPSSGMVNSVLLVISIAFQVWMVVGLFHLASARARNQGATSFQVIHNSYVLTLVMLILSLAISLYHTLMNFGVVSYDSLPKGVNLISWLVSDILFLSFVVVLIITAAKIIRQRSEIGSTVVFAWIWFGLAVLVRSGNYVVHVIRTFNPLADIEVAYPEYMNHAMFISNLAMVISLIVVFDKLKKGTMYIVGQLESESVTDGFGAQTPPM